MSGISAVSNAQNMFQSAATKLSANADPATIIQMTVANQQFKAGIKVMNVQNDMNKQLLNILA